VEELAEELPPSSDEAASPTDDEDPKSDEAGEEVDFERPIACWTYCKNCEKVVTPLVYISESTWKFSFGKFLEVFFYNRDAIMNAPEHKCSCQAQSATRLYFGCGKLAAQFSHERIRPFGVFVRRVLPMESNFRREEAMRRLEIVSEGSSKLFISFDKHIERISREARSLFNSPANRPEHLQTVVGELNTILSEVDHTAKTLQGKIASVSDNLRKQGGDESLNEALFRFPWFARRYLFMLASSWNEKLSTTGQAISTMKKLAASGSNPVMGPNVAIVGGDPLNEELIDCMKRLRKLNEQYSKYNVTEITEMLPTLPDTGNDLQQDGDYYEDEFDEPDASMEFAEGVDADVIASRRRLKTRPSSSRSARPTKTLGTRRNDEFLSDEDGEEEAAPKTAGGAVKSAITRFFNRGGRENDP
jgi:hypothetical protein